MLLHKKFGKTFIAVSVITGMSLAAAISLLPIKSVAVFFLTPFRVWELLAGALLALRSLASKQIPFSHAAPVLGFLFIFAGLYYFDSGTSFPGASALLPVVGAVMIILGGEQRGYVSAFLSTKMMVFIGAISYSLYLWHWPILVFWRYIFDEQNDSFFGLTLYISIAVFLSYISYKLIESPLRKASYSSASRRLVVLFLMLLIIFLSVGVYSKGFSYRFSESVIKADAQRKIDMDFNECDRNYKHPCIIGLEDGRESPDILIIGDSHAQAWAPAFDYSLKSKKIAAFFMPHSASAPFLVDYVDTSARDGYLTRDVALELIESKKVKKVIIVANWDFYLNSKSRYKHAAIGEETMAVPFLVSKTVDYLLRKNIKVIFLGPVPVYDKNVPKNYALTEKNHGAHQETNLLKQKAKYQQLIDALRPFTSHEDFKYVDVLSWFCKNGPCTYHNDEKFLYFDSNHLSRYGALYFKDEINASIH